MPVGSNGSDTIDPEYYTVAPRDGQTTGSPQADVDVGGDARHAAHRAPFYARFNQILDKADLDGLRQIA